MFGGFRPGVSFPPEGFRRRPRPLVLGRGLSPELFTRCPRPGPSRYRWPLASQRYPPVSFPKTALQRSGILAERAFRQSASVCSGSGSLTSPCSSRTVPRYSDRTCRTARRRSKAHIRSSTSNSSPENPRDIKRRRRSTKSCWIEVAPRQALGEPSGRRVVLADPIRWDAVERSPLLSDRPIATALPRLRRRSARRGRVGEPARRSDQFLNGRAMIALKQRNNTGQLRAAAGSRWAYRTRLHRF